MGNIQNEYMKRRFSTKYSQYNYEMVQLQFFNSLVYPMLCCYFVLASIYLGILMIGPDKDKISNFYKIIILLIIVLFPIFITPLEYLLYRGTRFVIETVTGNVFENDEYDYSI